MIHDDDYNLNEPTVPNPRVHADKDDYNAASHELETLKAGAVPEPPPSATTEPRGVPIYRKEAFVPPPPPAIPETAARARMRRRKARNRGGEWAWVIIAVALFGVLLTVGIGVLLIVRASTEEAEIVPTATAPSLAVLPTPVDARTVANTTTSNNSVIIGDVVVGPNGEAIHIEPWDGESRFTILVMGLDRRPGETGLRFRTDTMLLVSLDPVTNSAGILSIPRDLYIEMPGYNGLYRINEPMVWGELQSPGYGPQLAMQTVQYNLGIRVNEYLIVDFKAFIAIIDAIGGIEVDVPNTINDPQYPNMYYGYDPFYLPAGRHVLDGETALKYARTRHGSSDFERARRQQQVLFAIRDKILRLDMIPTLILQAPSLWAALQDNLYTGLSLEQVIQLALWAKDIPLENIRTGVITPEYVMSYTTERGASVLIPNRSRLGYLMQEVFGANYNQ